MYQEGGLFIEIVWKKYPFLDNHNQNGARIILGTALSVFPYLQENTLEYFKLGYLCQTMILGSMEDERMFSAILLLN